MFKFLFLFLHFSSIFCSFMPLSSSSPFQKYLSGALKLQLITFYKYIFSFFSTVGYPHSGFQHSHCCFAGTAVSSYYCENAVKHSQYCFPVSLYYYYYYSNFLVLPPFFWPLTSPAYFHRFLQLWYQNVQLLQEMLAMTSGISHFYTF